MRYPRVLLCLVLSPLVLSPLSAAAESSVTVHSQEAPLYSSPDPASPVIGKVKRGQVFKAEGTRRNGFERLVTQSGKPIWIRSSDLSAASDLVGGEAQATTTAAPASPRPFRRLTYDFGASTGISGTGSSYEFNLGVNYFFTEWLSWRNAPFFAMQSGSSSYYGLDTSIRAAYFPELGEGFRPGFLVGAGYRLASAGQSAPLAEAGITLRTAGLNLGASVKVILDSLVDSTAENQVLLSIQLAGGGAL